MDFISPEITGSHSRELHSKGMAVAVRGGLRNLAPRVGRGALAARPLMFNEQEVEEGEAVLEEHFPVRLHPDARIVSSPLPLPSLSLAHTVWQDAHIRRMARLYVQEHGNQLLEFMRNHDILSLEENEPNDEEEDLWYPEEQSVSEVDQASAPEQNSSKWSIKSILQWIWDKITLQSNAPHDDASSPFFDPMKDEQEEADSVLPSVLIHSTVAVAMLIIAAVVLSRSRDR